MLDARRLRELLLYDPQTGVFTWRVKPSRRVRVGAIAGCFDKEGYRLIKVEGRIYFAHRLAWLYMTGQWPVNLIDHINGSRSDNVYSNLRDVTHTVNMQNQRKAMCSSKSGLLGVCAPRKGKRRFSAAIRVNGDQRRLGWFDTATEAHAAYLVVKQVEHVGSTLGA